MKGAGMGIAAATMLICAALSGCGSSSADPVINVSCGTNLAAVAPASGSTIQLQRGCAFGGSLVLRSSHVKVTAYGSGPAPIIALGHDGAAVSVFGSHDVIENLTLRGVAPSFWNCHGHRTPAGHVDGVDLQPGSALDTVKNIKATGFYAAVNVFPGSSRDNIVYNTFTANLELNINNKKASAGAFGVLLRGDRSFVEHNTINDNQACSLAFGLDGSAIEVSGGSYNLISYNHASNDNAFTELGSPPGTIATGNYYSHNTVTADRNDQSVTFLVTRGSKSNFGPVLNTKAFFNTVKLTGKGNEGAVSYDWKKGDGTLLTLTKNNLDLGKNEVLFENGGFVNGGGNTFIGTCRPKIACAPKIQPYT
jgi:hypothetical protein